MGHVLLALSSPRAGRESDFEAWYAGEHIPDVLAVPGIVAARRLHRAPVQLTRDEPPYAYLTVYEIDADDVDRVLRDFRTGVRDGSIRLSDAVDPDRSFTGLYADVAAAGDPATEEGWGTDEQDGQ